MRFDGFRYGSRIDLVPSETPERYRLTQNQQSPQEGYETGNRRRPAANTQVDRTICSQKCKLLRATSCTAYGPPLASALAHALRSPLFRARLSHTNCSHGGSERSSSSALAVCLYRFRVTSKSCATTLISDAEAAKRRPFHCLSRGICWDLVYPAMVSLRITSLRRRNAQSLWFTALHAPRHVVAGTCNHRHRHSLQVAIWCRRVRCGAPRTKLPTHM
jgi:hypothetical protein